MFNLGLKHVLIWADRPTRLRNTWFGFLAFFYNFAPTSMSLSDRPFLCDIRDFKIRYGEGLLRRLWPSGTKVTTAYSALNSND